MIYNAYSRPILLTSGMLVVLGGLYMACAWGAASVADFMVRHEMEQWASGAVVPDRKRWEQHYEILNLALKLESDNADYQHDMGILYLYNAEHLSVGDKQIEQLIRKSLEHFSRAVALRPAWPNNWANIALIESTGEVLGAQYYRAVDRAMTLGAAVPDVQYRLSMATISRWNVLDEPFRRKAVANVLNGLKSRKKNDILEVLLHYDLLLVLCLESEFPDEFRTYCDQ